MEHLAQEEALELIISAIELAGYVPGKDITLALDCASSEFYKDGIYDYSIFEGEKGKKLSREEQVEYLKSMTEKYPIDSIEDGIYSGGERGCGVEGIWIRRDIREMIF